MDRGDRGPGRACGNASSARPSTTSGQRSSFPDSTTRTSIRPSAPNSPCRSTCPPTWWRPPPTSPPGCASGRGRRRPDEWIVGYGYDPFRSNGGRDLTRDDLDAACPQHPVLVVHMSLHAGVLNSAALARAGLSTAADAPSGGALGVDASGELDGVVHDQALVRRRLRRVHAGDPGDPRPIAGGATGRAGRIPAPAERRRNHLGRRCAGRTRFLAPAAFGGRRRSVVGPGQCAGGVRTLRPLPHARSGGRARGPAAHRRRQGIRRRRRQRRHVFGRTTAGRRRVRTRTGHRRATRRDRRGRARRRVAGVRARQRRPGDQPGARFGDPGAATHAAPRSRGTGSNTRASSTRRSSNECASSGSSRCRSRTMS